MASDASLPLDAASVIEVLGLVRHPEGGWYAETWRDDASTAIWFLLRTGEASRWHRVRTAAETWHHYLGDPLLLEVAADGEQPTTTLLGPDLRGGQRPQAVVPAGAWQRAEAAVDVAGYALVGCTVAPPFDFAAFELAPPGWSPPG